jgi:hypothetical protein
MKMNLHKGVQPDDIPVEALRMMISAPTRRTNKPCIDWEPEKIHINNF